MNIKLFALIFLLAACAACGGPSHQASSSDSQGSSEETPQLTQQVIEERINDSHVFDVLPESGKGEPVFWRFSEDEPKEIKVVQREDHGNRSTLILDIKTESAPRSRRLRHLEGQLKTEWELRTGWVLRRWEIVNTENISMKYRDIPKPDNTNSNTQPAR